MWPNERGALRTEAVEVGPLTNSFQYTMRPQMMAGKWERRWASFKAEPLHYLEKKGRQFARAPFDRYAELVLNRRNMLGFVASRPSGAFRPDYSDLLFLYDLVRKQKPSLVYEFGSGCSTVIIAQALRDNASATGSKGKIVSLEADERWADVTDKSFPAYLREHCEILFTPLRVQRFGEDSLYIHEACPKDVPDMVYVDGPALFDPVVGAGDVLLFEEKLRPGFTMIVDGRPKNVAAILRHTRRNFRVTNRRLFYNYLFELIS